MSRRRHTPEQIINKVRQAEVGLLTGATVAQVLVERWRKHCNTVRPHSSLGYRLREVRSRLKKQPVTAVSKP